MSKNVFRSQAETFNPQIHVEELSLAVHGEKHNEVHKGKIQQFAKYAKFTSLLFLTDRVNNGVKNRRIKRDDAIEIADNAYRVKYEGLELMPLYSMGAVVIGEFHNSDDMTSVDGVTYSGGAVNSAEEVKTNTLGSFAAKHDPTNNIWGDKLNPNDKISLSRGLDQVEFIVINKRRASTDDHYIYDGKFIVGGLFTEESFKEDEVLMESGNAFGQGSTTGFQRDGKSWWEIFFTHKSRYTLRFTGDSLRQKKAVWCHPTVKNPTAKTPGAYWEFEEEQRADRIFAIMNELSLRYNVSTMTSAGHTWFEMAGKNQLTNSHFAPHSGITAPSQGDGFITSMVDTVDLSYDPNFGLEIEDLQTMINVLSANSPAGNSGNLFAILTDRVGRMNVDNALKRLIGVGVPMSGGGSVNNILATNVMVDLNNMPTKLGFEITEYEYMGNKFIVIEDELLQHPGQMGSFGGMVGNGDLFFMNITPMPDGTPMFELLSGARGRFFIKKYVNGLHSLSPSGESSLFAASGFDGAVAHYFSELGAINYVSNTSGVLRASRRFNGRVSEQNSGFDFSKFPYLGPAAGQL